MTIPMDLLEGLIQADFAETLAAVVGRADLVVMSPPYEDARTYGANVSWVFEGYQRLGDSIKAALRPDGGQCLMVLDGPVRDYRGDGFTERSVMPWRVLLDWKDRLGLVTPDRLAYARNGQPGDFGGVFRSDWEPLLWFASPGKRTFNKMALARPESAGHSKSTAISTRGGHGDETKASKRSGTAYLANLVMPGNLWRYGPVGNGDGCKVGTENVDHPARFPYRLARDLVKCFSDPGDLVVDPFLGSGTTMIAALDFGRRFYGGDLLARQSDGRPWIDIAREIAEARYAQRDIFQVDGVEPANVEQLEIGAASGR